MSKTLSGETTLTVLGLNEGKDYYFRVYAENKYGKSPALEAKEAVAPKRALGILNHILSFCNSFLKYVLIILLVSDLHFYFFDADFMYLTEPPMSPASLHVKDITKTSLTLTWEPPASGPEGITGYNIERRLSNSDEWERVARVPDKVLSHHLKGLKEGHAFFFRVTAENAAGTSKPTELRSPVELKGRKGMIILI